MKLRGTFIVDKVPLSDGTQFLLDEESIVIGITKEDGFLGEIFLWVIRPLGEKTNE